MSDQTKPEPKIEHVVRKFYLGKEPKDCEYWLTKSMPERLDALLNLINRHHGWTDETQPRMEKILVVIKPKVMNEQITC